MSSLRVRSATIALILMSLVGCSRRSVILEARHAYELTGAADSWVPTRSEIAALEKQLPDFVRRETPLHRSISRDYKQYVGIVREGRRLICVNAWASLDGRETQGWRERPIIWGGGGDSVWQVEYDPAAQRFERFQLNGPL